MLFLSVIRLVYYVLPLIAVNRIRGCHSFSSKSSLTSSSSSSSSAITQQQQQQQQKNQQQKNQQQKNQQQKNQQQIYLFSLNWIKEDDPEYYLKKDVRRLWEWKDEILGDGRDFFVPKPKTLMTLQHYLLQNIPNLTECSIISNCARLEILCSCDINININNFGATTTNNSNNNNNNNEYDALNKKDEEEKLLRLQKLLARDISDCFITQMNHYAYILDQKNTWMKILTQLPINIDQPESVLTKNTTTTSTTSFSSDYHYDNDNSKSNSNSSSWWNVVVGTEAILTRLCKISAGMASRPSRPDRPVIFRPFASRDAHVLLQLKRTRENIAFSSSSSEDNDNDNDNDDDYDININNNKNVNVNESETRKRKQKRRQRGRRKLLPSILDCALRAGKAARNSVIVPEIEELRELTSAESSVSCSSSELQTSQIIAKAAYEKGIRPLINDCITKLDDSTDNKNNIEQRIVELRRGAIDLLLLEIGKDEHNNKTTTSDNNGNDNDNDNDNETVHRELRSWLNRRLHGPTVELRSRSQQRHNNRCSRSNRITEKDIVHDDHNDNGKYYDDNDNKSFVEDCLNEIRKELLLEHHRLSLSFCGLKNAS